MKEREGAGEGTPGGGLGPGWGSVPSACPRPFPLIVLDLGWPVVHACWAEPAPVPGPAELSRGPLSPNACRGLGHRCWVSGWIGFSPGSLTDATLPRGWPGGQGEAAGAPRGPQPPLSVVLDCGAQVRVPWSPARADSHGDITLNVWPGHKGLDQSLRAAGGGGGLSSTPVPRGRTVRISRRRRPGHGKHLCWRGGAWELWTLGEGGVPRMCGHGWCVNRVVCTGVSEGRRWGCEDDACKCAYV